jgi:hypothetical protein
MKLLEKFNTCVIIIIIIIIIIIANNGLVRGLSLQGNKRIISVFAF